MRNEEALWSKEGKLGYLTLNRPEKLNALSQGMMREIDEVMEEAARDTDVRVLIIRGAGRAFSAGYDLNPNAEGRGASRGDPVDDRDRLTANMERWLRIWDFPKPVIAQVHGYCLAGATQMCVMCDITVVAEDARIGWPSIPVGGGFISPMWTWLIGPKRAKQMAYIPGSQMDGKTASDWGFANYAVPVERLEADVRQLAEQIAVVPSKILKMKKHAINRMLDVQGFRVAVQMGSETDALLHASEPVEQLSGMIREFGLKEAIAMFKAGDLGKSAEAADKPTSAY